MWYPHFMDVPQVCVCRLLDNRRFQYSFPRMWAILLLSNFSFHGTAGVRGWFDVAAR
jgi:hypothetical protein